MEGSRVFPETECTETASDVVAFAQAHCDDAHIVDSLHDQLGSGPFELVCLFISPEADFQALVDATSRRFGAADVVACTTAGELGRDGYEEQQVVAIGDGTCELRQHRLDRRRQRQPHPPHSTRPTGRGVAGRGDGVDVSGDHPTRSRRHERSRGLVRGHLG